MSLVSVVMEFADRIKNGRDNVSILEAIEDEMVELREEVYLDVNGLVPGSDGIFGESIDVIVSALDLIRQVRPNISVEELEREIDAYARVKCRKWEIKYGAPPNK
jgi:hypothetical protein